LFFDDKLWDKFRYINMAVRRSVMGALASTVKKVLLFVDFGIIPGVGLGDRRFEKRRRIRTNLPNPPVPPI
jgi:hypothetical protein